MNCLRRDGSVFRANVIDTYQDNPTRERATWLCDPLFSASAAPFLCGHTKAERNMFQNYMLPDHFADMPDGMLPNCYPADHLGRRLYSPMAALACCATGGLS